MVDSAYEMRNDAIDGVDVADQMRATLSVLAGRRRCPPWQCHWHRPEAQEHVRRSPLCRRPSVGGRLRPPATMSRVPCVWQRGGTCSCAPCAPRAGCTSTDAALACSTSPPECGLRTESWSPNDCPPATRSQQALSRSSTNKTRTSGAQARPWVWEAAEKVACLHCARA